MRWAALLALALQLPIDAPNPRPDAPEDAHQRRRQAIERMNAGVDMFVEGDISGAKAALQDAIRIDPTYSRSFVNNARLAIATERLVDAEADLVHALELIDAEQARVSSVGRTEAEADANSKEFNALSELRAQAQFDLGRVHLACARDSEHYVEQDRDEHARLAVEAFGQATTMSINGYPPTDRGDYEAQHLRGVAYELLDEPGAAARSYRACIDAQPNYGPCWAALTRLYFDFGEERLAEVVIDTGTKVAPNNAEIWLAAAELRWQLDRPQEAVDAGDRAKAIDPDLVAVHFVLGMAYADLRKREQAQAELQAYLNRQIAQPEARVRAAEDMLAWLMQADAD